MSTQFLAVLILRCEEPARIAEFYQNTVGLPLEQGNENEFTCMLGATFFAIHGLQPGQTATTSTEIGIHIPDLDKFVKELGQKKIALNAPIKDYPWARAATILDPLGNSIYLMQLPERSIQNIRGQVAKDFSL
jgi:hypothetical protein